ncbi:hypothetical protein C7475_101954 [Chitinophaga sp. S165]|nr:hypothetical protein C7475_101954 [Chitinophaga sp. S165]
MLSRSNIFSIREAIQSIVFLNFDKTDLSFIGKASLFLVALPALLEASTILPTKSKAL